MVQGSAERLPIAVKLVEEQIIAIMEGQRKQQSYLKEQLGDRRLEENREKLKNAGKGEFFLWGGERKQGLGELKREFLEDIRKYVNS